MTPQKIPDSYEAGLIVKTLSSLNLPLLEGLRKSIGLVDRAFESPLEMDTRRYPAQRALLILSKTNSLIFRDPIDGWRLEAESRYVHLFHEEMGLKVRMLKCDAYTGGLTHAGNNPSRRALYYQPAAIREETELLHNLAGPTLDDVTMFVTWEEASDGDPVLTAYKPLSPGKWRSGAPASLVVSLGIDQKDYDELAFPAQTSEPLFFPQQAQSVEDLERAAELESHN